MSQTGKQDLDEALANPGALQKQLDGWERRQRVKSRIHASSALLFFIGMAAALWFLFENSAKAAEATGATIAFALIGIFHTIMALSSRGQSPCGNDLQRGSGREERTPKKWR